MSTTRRPQSWSRPGSSGGTATRTSREHQRSSLDARYSQDGLQRFILTDPIAVRFLEDDPSVTVLDRRRTLSGYQCYIVEQWATSRSNATFTITTHTGDASDTLICSTLGIPKDEALWSPKLKAYFRALNHSHARRKDIPEGILMITSLPGFPSTLTVIAVPDGDISRHYADFFVNENLKRLGCSGRVGLTLSYPNNATIAKFHQLYRTSDKNALYSSVIELVRMCQTALYMFDLLEVEFIDGLLCDITEKAILRWWTEMGADVYRVEPHDGILGPSSVAGLVGLYIGARNRLHALNEPVGKDAFDLEGMKRGVAHFQKYQHVQKSRRLCRITLRKLHANTEKAAASEGWRLPRAVTTAVAELSGRGEELVAETTTRRGKAGIADVETTDIDTLAQLVSGERGKWLWQGKALKRTNAEGHGEASLDILTSPIATTAPKRNEMPRGSDGPVPRSFEHGKPAHGDGQDPDRPRAMTHREAAIQKVHGVLDDGLAGIDRLKDAVYVRAKRPFDRQDGPTVDHKTPPKTDQGIVRPPLARSVTSPAQSGSSASSRATASAEMPGTQGTLLSKGEQASQTHRASRQLHNIIIPDDYRRSTYNEAFGGVLEGEDPADSAKVAAEHGLEAREETSSTQLHRTRSDSDIGGVSSRYSTRHDFALQRHMSFSVAEGSMFRSQGPEAPLDSKAVSETQYIEQLFYQETLRRIELNMMDLSSNEATWTIEQLDRFERLVQQSTDDKAYLESLQEAPSRALRAYQDSIAAILREEKDAAGEGKRELETLAARLDYEMNNLKAKIEEVEAGVQEYERSVDAAEARVEEVGRELSGSGTWQCVIC